jgi:hypothetical protein
LLERNVGRIAAALRRFPLLGVVHQYLPHGAGRYREEVLAVLPVERVMIHQLPVRFVHEFRRAEGNVLRLAVQLIVGNAAELLVDDGKEFVNRRLSSIAQLCQKPRNVGAIVGHHQRKSE